MVGLQFMAAAQSQAARPIKYATEYDWSMSPAEELGQAGAETVSLASCPPGVKGNEPEYWVLINGSEPAKVTGGTCAGDGRPGTLQFAEQARSCRGRNSFERIRRAAGSTHRRALCAHQSSRHSAVRRGGGAAERIEGIRASLDSLFQPHRGFLRLHS